MGMYEIITKKKQGKELTEEEIKYFVLGYLSGEIPDYQISAMLMAICFKGMTPEETAVLTKTIAESGDTVDLSDFGDGTVDKHSTGGVGDKTTLIVAPIVASLGCKVAKMSGRGLGHTGGTIDKLESIPGYNVSLSTKSFKRQVEDIGIAVVGQTGNLAPADKKLYALRDVTATVDSLPLIASSIMGKKLAAGSKSIVLDVKCGSGSFMKSEENALALAECMVDIGRKNGRRVSALITDMDIPLGRAIGNALEVKEALEVLSGKGDEDITEVCIALASEMVSLSLGLDINRSIEKCKEALLSGLALKTFEKWISAQGADASFIKNPDLLPKASLMLEVKAKSDGYITRMDTEKIGIGAVALGAGREKKDDVIDYGAGILLKKKTYDEVKEGEVIALLYASDEQKLHSGEKIFLEAIEYGDSTKKKGCAVIKTVR